MYRITIFLLAAATLFGARDARVEQRHGVDAIGGME
jgi:hypothetical protein